MSESNIVVINQGRRLFTLQPITVDEPYEMADGTKAIRQKVVKERLLLPGQSIETMNKAEADLLLGYNDIKDAAKIVPANDARIKVLETEIKRLTVANAKLAEAPSPAPTKKAEPEEKPVEEKPSKKKGK